MIDELNRNGLACHINMRGNALDDITGVAGTVNSATLTDGRYGQSNRAYSFGTNQDIQYSNLSAHQITNNLTVAVFAKLPTNPSGSNRYFAGKYSGTANQRGWAVSIDMSGSKYTLRISKNGTTDAGQFLTLASSFTADNAWHLYAFTFASGVITMYVDNQNVGSTTDASVTSIHNSTAGLSIGSTTGTSYLTDGIVGEIRMYNKILTSFEMNRILRSVG